jgi:UDP-N-acetylmuramyl pentapeptide synthase
VIQGRDNASANFNARNSQFGSDKTAFTLDRSGPECFCEIPLIPPFEMKSALAVLAVIHESRGIALKDLIEAGKTSSVFRPFANRKTLYKV